MNFGLKCRLFRRRLIFGFTTFLTVIVATSTRFLLLSLVPSLLTKGHHSNNAEKDDGSNEGVEEMVRILARQCHSNETIDDTHDHSKVPDQPVRSFPCFAFGRCLLAALRLVRSQNGVEGLEEPQNHDYSAQHPVRKTDIVNARSQHVKGATQGHDPTRQGQDHAQRLHDAMDFEPQSAVWQKFEESRRDHSTWKQKEKDDSFVRESLFQWYYG